MTEWGVVGVIVALIGLLAAVMAPIVKLNTNIVTLVERLAALNEDMKSLTDDNSAGHKRLWDKNEEQDRRLNAHDIEIDRLKNKKGE